MPRASSLTPLRQTATGARPVACRRVLDRLVLLRAVEDEHLMSGTYKCSRLLLERCALQYTPERPGPVLIQEVEDDVTHIEPLPIHRRSRDLPNIERDVAGLRRARRDRSRACDRRDVRLPRYRVHDLGPRRSLWVRRGLYRDLPRAVRRPLRRGASRRDPGLYKMGSASGANDAARGRRGDRHLTRAHGCRMPRSVAIPLVGLRQ